MSITPHLLLYFVIVSTMMDTEVVQDFAHFRGSPVNIAKGERGVCFARPLKVVQDLLHQQ